MPTKIKQLSSKKFSIDGHIVYKDKWGFWICDSNLTASQEKAAVNFTNTIDIEVIDAEIVR